MGRRGAWMGSRPLSTPACCRRTRPTIITPTELVFGVEINGDARAYPLRILDWHEMANDVVGGVPVALAYCTLCGAGVLFDTRVGDATYEFGSSGFLMRSNKLMYDRTTYTLWNQLTGEPVLGKLADGSIELKRLPVVVSTWQAWHARHPDTQVLSLETGHLRDYTPGNPYGSYFASPDTMFPAEGAVDRLPDKARIFALYIDGQPHAYATADVARERVVNDQVGDTSVVVIAGGPELKGVGIDRIRGPAVWDAGCGSAGLRAQGPHLPTHRRHRAGARCTGPTLANN